MGEDKKEEDEAEGKVAWATGKKSESGNSNLNEKKYPSLAKSMQHASAVAAHAAVNDDDRGLQTSKNVFATLQNKDQSDSDEDAPKSTKKGILVQKKKGETEKAATQRAKKGGRKEDSDEDEEEVEEKKQAAQTAAEKKKKDKKEEKKQQEAQEDED